jgi:hypothetical protein
MDIDRIKSGRPKSKFIIALEWLTIGTLTALLLGFLASSYLPFLQQAITMFTFILLLEAGLLSIFYGVEGARYRIIWLAYPTPSGSKRVGFSGKASLLVSAIYVAMGLALMVFAISFVYLNKAG